MPVFTSYNRSFSNTSQDQDQTQQALTFLQAILRSAGISDFAAKGNLDFSQNRIVGPGILDTDVLAGQFGDATGHLVSLPGTTTPSTPQSSTVSSGLDYDIATANVRLTSSDSIPGAVNVYAPSTRRGIDRITNSLPQPAFRRISQPRIPGPGGFAGYGMDDLMRNDLVRSHLSSVSDLSLSPSEIPELDIESMANRRMLDRIVEGLTQVPDVDLIPSLEDISIWIGDEIVLRQGITVTMDSRVKHLVILANKITVEPDFAISWLPEPLKDWSLPANRPGALGTAAHGQNGFQGHKHAFPGVDGTNGSHGVNGADGDDAPEVEMWTAEINRLPLFSLPGQNGADGQDGQNGQNGGNGGVGLDGESDISIRQGRYCQREAGRGGDGGRGGNAGSGGNGGDGGKPGRVSLYAPTSVLDQHPSAFIDATPGRGGQPGNNGTPGQGGRGGNPGAKPGPCTKGTRGTDGGPGAQATRQPQPGQDYVPPANDPGPYMQYAIQSVAVLLPLPYITAPYPRRPIAVGESLTIIGANFAAGDVIRIGGNTYNPDSVTETSITLTVPDLPNGNKTFEVYRPSDRTTSNRSNFIVKLAITDLEQDGIKLSENSQHKFRPGHPLRLYVSGLSNTTTVLIDNSQVQNVNRPSAGILEFDLPNPPNPTVETLGFKVSELQVFDTSSNLSDYRGIAVETFLMLALGDSIIWGQGLAENEKFRNQVFTLISNQLQQWTTHVRAFAHSGATIGGEGTENEGPRLPGEIPNSFPTLWGQLREISLDSNLRGIYPQVDLILLDGGINDVGLERIFGKDGSTDQELIDSINISCYTLMRAFLERIASDDWFKNATILVTGYYRIVSGGSDLDAATLLDAFGIPYPHLLTLVPGLAFAPLGPGWVITAGLSALEDFLVRRAVLFFDESTRRLSAAVNDANATITGPQRIHFVDSGFRARNAMWADESLIWEPHTTIEGLLRPNDSVQDSRIDSCRLLADHGDLPGSLRRCERAALGHPNVQGAAQYTQAIMDTLNAIGFLNRF